MNHFKLKYCSTLLIFCLIIISCDKKKGNLQIGEVKYLTNWDADTNEVIPNYAAYNYHSAPPVTAMLFNWNDSLNEDIPFIIPFDGKVVVKDKVVLIYFSSSSSSAGALGGFNNLELEIENNNFLAIFLNQSHYKYNYPGKEEKFNFYKLGNLFLDREISDTTKFVSGFLNIRISNKENTELIDQRIIFIFKQLPVSR